MSYKDPEKVRAADRRWKAANPEKVRAAERKRYAANPEKLRAADRRWRAANLEKVRAAERKRYAANPEKDVAYSRKWYASNKQEARIKAIARSRRNRTRIKTLALVKSGAFNGIKTRLKKRKKMTTTISQTKRQAFFGRYNTLEASRKDVDYQTSVLAHDIRAEFPRGAAGDAGFLQFLDTEFNLGGACGEEWTERVKVLAICPDALEYKNAGGFPILRRLLDRPLPAARGVVKKSQIEQRGIPAIIKEEQNGEAPYKPRAPPINYERDAQQLAEFIANLRGVSVPPMVNAIVQRYVAKRSKKAA